MLLRAGRRPLLFFLLVAALLAARVGSEAALNPYRTLGVPRSASAKEIKTAYRKLARKLHPDVSKASEEEANARFRAINVAFETLSDPRARRQYDLSGDLAGEMPGSRAAAAQAQAQARAYAQWAAQQGRFYGGHQQAFGGDALAGPAFMLLVVAVTAVVAALPHVLKALFDDAEEVADGVETPQSRRRIPVWNEDAPQAARPTPFWHPLLPALASWGGLPPDAALRAGCTPYSPVTLHALLEPRSPPPLLLLLLLPATTASASTLIARFSEVMARLPRDAVGAVVPCWVCRGDGDASAPPPPPGLRSLLPLHVRLAAALRRLALPRLAAARKDSIDVCNGSGVGGIGGSDVAVAAEETAEAAATAHTAAESLEDAAASAAAADADAGGVLVAAHLNLRADAAAAAVCPRVLGRGAGSEDGDAEAEAVSGWLLSLLLGSAPLRDATDLLYAPLAAAAAPY